MIAIFQGHVGKDLGATGENYCEATITGIIGSKVASLLGEKPINGSFEERITLSRGADLGIEIHCDSFSNPKAEGFHVVHWPGVKGSLLASCVTNSMILGGIRPNREKESRTDLFMLQKTKFPCILIECGFLTNPKERDLLYTEFYQTKISIAIAHGVHSYLRS